MKPGETFSSMSRLARVVIPGCPHHVTQRGNHRQQVFFSHKDFEMYLKLLRKYFPKYGITLIGFSLMPNHTHKIAVPHFPKSLAKGVGVLHNDFARWQQKLRDQTGHLWQNRFFSVPMDEDYFWRALRYAELNPVRAGLVRNASDWPWSSARAHVTGIDESGLLDMDTWRSRFDCDRWRNYLEEGCNSDREYDQIRKATRTGRPMGTDDFIEQLEKLTGKALRPRKRGPMSGQNCRGKR
jgi:putative transposase